MGGKICRRCGEFKPMDRFSKHPGMRDGFTNICKDCKNTEKRAKHSRNIRFFSPEEDAILRAEYPFVSRGSKAETRCFKEEQWRHISARSRQGH